MEEIKQLASPTRPTIIFYTIKGLDILRLRGATLAHYLAKKESSQKIQIVADMTRISCGGICGEDNFRCR
jgi:hypothetical protein